MFFCYNIDMLTNSIFVKLVNHSERLLLWLKLKNSLLWLVPQLTMA